MRNAGSLSHATTDEESGLSQRGFFSNSACAGGLAWVYLRMGEVHEIKSRWWEAGEVVLWVVFYFWAVWIFNAFLPPKPEQTPFETYLGNQLRQQTDGGASAERGQQLDDGTGRPARR